MRPFSSSRSKRSPSYISQTSMFPGESLLISKAIVPGSRRNDPVLCGPLPERLTGSDWTSISGCDHIVLIGRRCGVYNGIGWHWCGRRCDAVVRRWDGSGGDRQTIIRSEQRCNVAAGSAACAGVAVAFPAWIGRSGTLEVGTLPKMVSSAGENDDSDNEDNGLCDHRSGNPGWPYNESRDSQIYKNVLI